MPMPPSVNLTALSKKRQCCAPVYYAPQALLTKQTSKVTVVAQGAGAIELIPWPHADQAHEWAQSIQADFSLNIQVAWTRLTDPSHLSYHKQVELPLPFFVTKLTGSGGSDTVDVVSQYKCLQAKMLFLVGSYFCCSVAAGLQDRQRSLMVDLSSSI